MNGINEIKHFSTRCKTLSKQSLVWNRCSMKVRGNATDTYSSQQVLTWSFSYYLFVISDHYEINRIEIYFIFNRRARRSVRAARGAADRGLRHISQESPRARGRGANFKLLASCLSIEWFSKRTGTSFQNGARSKNVDKKLGRERRRVVLKSDLAVVATRILTSAF